MGQEPTRIKIELFKTAKEEEKKPFDSFEVPINPPEYTLTKGAQIAEIGIPGLDSPLLQFIRGTNEQITLKLFFDTTQERTDVREKTQKFYQLVKINSDLHAPPICKLTWGKSMGGLVGKSTGTEGTQENKFRGIVSNITQRFLLFSPDGIPLRAEMDLTFKEFKTIGQQLRELKLKSADHTKLRTVRRGDTLSGIASEEYDDSGKWREIASANEIANPRALVPGQLLQIPPLEESY
jgi:nucleoid-associated protein YgaU